MLRNTVLTRSDLGEANIEVRQPRVRVCVCVCARARAFGGVSSVS